MHKRILSALCVIAMLGATLVPAQAHQVPDPAQLGSISITMTYQGETVPGGSLTLFRVADVVEEDGNYSFALTGEFTGCEIPMEDPSAALAADALAQTAGELAMQGTTREIDENGMISFENLKIGLYLLIQEEAAPGFHPAAPFLVSVPANDNGVYVYDVDASPKLELETAPTEPEEPPTEPTKPSEPELPDTGQMTWPVPILAVGGLFLVVIGWYLCTSGKKRSDEA